MSQTPRMQIWGVFFDACQYISITASNNHGTIAMNTFLSKALVKFAILTTTCLLLCTAAAAAPVYIIAGQSNAIGQGRVSNLAPEHLSQVEPDPSADYSFSTAARRTILRGGVAAYNTGSLVELGPVGGRFGVEIGLLDGLQAAGVHDPFVIKFAAGGARLATDFLPGSANRELFYDQMISFIKSEMSAFEASTGERAELAGLFWLQGESDATLGGTFTTSYQSNFSNLISSIRSDLSSPDLDVIFVPLDESGGVVNGTAEQNAEYQANTVSINNGIEALSLTDDNLFVADSTTRLSRFDHVHFDEQALLDLGNSLATVISIPEPTSTTLLGLGGLALLTRRNHHTEWQ